MGTKSYTAPLEFKADPTSPGEFRAIIATFNTIDKDGDVTLPGAFKDGQRVKIAAWGHNWGALPVGMGTVHQDQQRAWVDGKFFLDTPDGQAHYATVKNLGSDQEWSYGFKVEDQSFGQFQQRDVRFLRLLDTFEASPVMVGAGVDTRTDAIKSAPAAPRAKAAIRPHGTATDSGTWDGPANEARLPNDGGAALFRTAYAWVDPEADPDTKAAYRFIHHDVSADGKVGAANMKACLTGIGVLNGGRGGTTIPDADKAGVHAHLARHLKDGDMNVPPLKSHDGAESKQWGDDDAPEGSYEALGEDIEDVFEATQPPGSYVECVGTYPDHAILRVVTWPQSPMGVPMAGEPDETFYSVPYVMNADGSIALGVAVEVEEQTSYVPTLGKALRLLHRLGRKEGRRNATADMRRIQQVHDLTAELGASCDGGMAAADGGKSAAIPTDGFDLSFPDHSEGVRVAVSEWVARCTAGAATRRTDGKGEAISPARRTAITEVRDALRADAAALDALLADDIAGKAAPQPDTLSLFADYQRIRARQLGVGV